MKSLYIKIIFIISIFSININNAQTIDDYINFYNVITPKLNIIASHKTQFYGQNFSSFYNELSQKEIGIVDLDYDAKKDSEAKYYVLRLFFSDSSMWSVATDNTFQYPWISITFQDEIPVQIKQMVLQNNGKWDNSFVQFFSNRKIEKIKFVGINGYNSNNWAAK